MLGEYPLRLSPVVSRRRCVAVSAAGLTFLISVLCAQPRLLAYWNVPLLSSGTLQATVSPGSIAVARNTSCTLSCILRRPVAPSAQLTLSTLTGNSGRRYFLLRPLNPGLFTYVVEKAADSFTYSFRFGSTVFGPETVCVVSPPQLHALQVTLTPPRYTGRSPISLPEGKGSFAAYAGTLARISLSSHFPLKQALFIAAPRDTVSFNIQGNSALGVVEIQHELRYSFCLTDTLLQRNDSLPSFFVDILPDYPPSVRFLKPGVNKIISPEQAETLWIEGIDDMGIRTLSCKWRTSIEPDSIITWDMSPSKPAQTVIRAEAVWNLTPLSLYPGDTVYYWAEARDNKPFGPAQIAVSDTFWLRLPGIEEIHESIARKESDAQQTLESVKDYQQSMKNRLEQLMRSAKGKQELTWEEKKIVEDLAKNFTAQVDSLSQAVSSLQQAIEQMQKHGDLSSDLLRKMNEVREAVKQLIAEYGDSVLFDPPKNGESVSWQDMKKALEKMKNVLPDLQRHLEDALKYLETVRKDQELARLASRAHNMAERQLGLSQDQAKDRIKRQEDLLREIDKLGKELDSIAGGDDPPFGRKDIPSLDYIQSMQRAMEAEIARQQTPQNAQMSRMSQALQSLSQELMSMLSSAMMAQILKDNTMLLDMARDVLDISSWQKELDDVSLLRQNTSLTAAQQQALMEALKKSMEKLDSLKAMPPSMMKGLLAGAQEALEAMKQALAAIGGGNASGPSGQAGARLNSLASALLASASRMGQQCPGSCPSGMDGGLLPGLRKLSGKQAAINSLTSELLQQMLQQGTQEGGMSMGTSSRQAAEAAQKAQQELAEELKRLADTYAEEAARGGMEKKMKELEDEARRLAEMLKNPPPDVGDRQERFLVRLLQTTLSMHTQDEGKEERKSTSAKVVFSGITSAGPARGLKDADSFFRIRSQALGGNFPEHYRLTIQTYFDSLGVLFLVP